MLTVEVEIEEGVGAITGRAIGPEMLGTLYILI
jgi:hypothetical protein